MKKKIALRKKKIHLKKKLWLHFIFLHTSFLFAFKKNDQAKGWKTCFRHVDIHTDSWTEVLLKTKSPYISLHLLKIFRKFMSRPKSQGCPEKVEEFLVKFWIIKKIKKNFWGFSKSDSVFPDPRFSARLRISGIFKSYLVSQWAKL